MQLFKNPYRGIGLDHSDLSGMPYPSDNAAAPMALLQRCPAAKETPLIDAPVFAQVAGVARVTVKDERARMGLGSFKALGAAYVIACDAERNCALGRTYVTASAGNHGLSVAAGAAAFGAQAVIYLAETVPQAFADRLTSLGASVIRQGATYEESMKAAMLAAKDNGWELLSDSSWSGYTDRPHVLMEGYLTLMAEAVNQLDTPPSHIFLQAGVGGLAAACATYARKIWGDVPQIVVVEPDAAPALFASVQAGKPVATTGPVSSMGRLDCKEPSQIGLKGLARDADVFMTVTEAEGAIGAQTAQEAGIPSTPSGAGGLAGLIAARGALGLSERSHVLLILSEGPEV